MSKNYPDVLSIAEENRRITLAAVDTKSWWGSENGFSVFRNDYNQIELTYAYTDEYGVSFGLDEYISTFDIKYMADCIRIVIYQITNKAEYSCQHDLLRICIEYDPVNDVFTFTVAFAETLTWECHITVSKAGLTRSALDEYIQPFFLWERKYPIV